MVSENVQRLLRHFQEKFRTISVDFQTPLTDSVWMVFKVQWKPQDGMAFCSFYSIVLVIIAQLLLERVLSITYGG